MIIISELERDALAESFNLSLGEAAATFSSIVNEEIFLSVPTVEIYTPNELTEQLEYITQHDPSGLLCSISQNFQSKSGINTDTFLLFPEKGSLEIVRRMIGNSTSAIEHISELEQDALAEIGNIIINSCMGSLSNLFKTELIGTLPNVESIRPKEMFLPHKDDEVILVAKICMTMLTQNISGYVLFIMDLPSLEAFLKQIRELFHLDDESGRLAS